MSGSEPYIHIPPPPVSKRTLSTERHFFHDLLDDLTLRVEWLEQVIETLSTKNDEGARLAAVRLREFVDA